MSILASLLVTASSSSPVVSEFERVCVRPTSAVAVETALARGGWKSFAPGRDTMLGKMLSKSTEMMKSVGASAEFKNYWRLIDGRRIEVSLSAGPVPTADNRLMVGCNMYDFTAQERSPEDKLITLAGAPPSDRTERQGVRILVWTGVFGPHSAMRASYVPVGRGAEAVLGFAGEAFVASFFEGTR